MRIEVTRSGGVAGIRLHAALDSDALADEERQAIEALVEAARFFELPAELVSGMPDAFLYDVIVVRAELRHEVRADDGAAPEPLRALVRTVIEHGRGPA